MTIDLGDGKQVIVSGDRGVHLMIWAYGGRLGVDLTNDDAFAVASSLIAAVRKRRKAVADRA